MNFIKISNDNKVIMTEEEKDLFIKLVKRHLELMPKVYRKRNSNWIVVQHLTKHGCGYSILICKYLNIDPDSYKWEELGDD